MRMRQKPIRDGRNGPRDAGGPVAIDREALQGAALGVGVALTEGQAERLARFGELLAKWNRVYNLTANATADGIVRLHLADSLTLAEHIRRRTHPGSRVLDVGSGGGLPGVPMAVLFPEVEFTLVDAVAKKAAFLTQAAAVLGLRNLRAVHARVEALEAGPFDLVTSRAFAELSVFVGLTAGLLAEGGRWLAMKGRYPAEEIAALPDWVRVEAVLPLASGAGRDERHLVVVARSHVSE